MNQYSIIGLPWICAHLGMDEFGNYTLQTNILDDLLIKHQPKTIYCRIIEAVSFYHGERG
jgi:hypothetical protein